MQLSIIVPVYNGETYVECCVKSILKARSCNIEIILVNDGSTDNTDVICEKLVKRDTRLKYYKIQNSGVAGARNFGLEHAKGDYIVFVDSDDSVSDGYKDLLYSLTGNTDFIMTGYSTVNIMTKQVISEFENYDYYIDIHEFCSNIEKWLSPPYLLSPWGKVFKRTILLRNNIQFPVGINYGEDVIFVMKYLMHCKSILCVKNTGYLYSIGNLGALTGKFNENAIDYDVIGLKFLSQLLTKNNVLDKDSIIRNRLRSNFTLYA